MSGRIDNKDVEDIEGDVNALSAKIEQFLSKMSREGTAIHGGLYGVNRDYAGTLYVNLVHLQSLTSKLSKKLGQMYEFEDWR